MAFDLTFNNISAIPVSWRLVLLVEEGVPRQNHRPAASQTFYRLHLTWAGFDFTTLVVIGTNYIGSYKSYYHKITTTTPPLCCGKHICIKDI